MLRSLVAFLHLPAAEEGRTVSIPECMWPLESSALFPSTFLREMSPSLQT